MATFLENLIFIALAFFVVSIFISTLNHILYIRPIALKLQGKRNFWSKFIFVSGQELSDYWDVEKVAKIENNQRLFSRLKVFRYSMYSTVFFFIITFILGFATFIAHIIN